MMIPGADSDYDSHSDKISSDDDNSSIEYGIDGGHNQQPEKLSTGTSSIWSRCIIHLDVDCFYCQCEERSRGSGAAQNLRRHHLA